MSDVSDIPDAPDPDGWIVAIPPERVGEVLALVGDGRPESRLPEARFGFPLETVTELGGTVAEVDGSGRFRLDAAGETLVCRLRTSRWNDLVGAEGCVRAELPAGGVVRVTNGEAGLAGEVDDQG